MTRSPNGTGEDFLCVLQRSKQNIAKILCGLVLRSSRFLGVSLALFASSTARFSIAATTMSSVKKRFERLPTSVLPKNYKLTLQPNLTEFTFTGEEVIDVEVIPLWQDFC